MSQRVVGGGCDSPESIDCVSPRMKGRRDSGRNARMYIICPSAQKQLPLRNCEVACARAPSSRNEDISRDTSLSRCLAVSIQRRLSSCPPSSAKICFLLSPLRCRQCRFATLPIPSWATHLHGGNDSVGRGADRSKKSQHL